MGKGKADQRAAAAASSIRETTQTVPPIDAAGGKLLRE